jgi:hypothetical protein
VACGGFKIGHRRLFVKALVMEWYRQKEEGERLLSPQDAERLIKGQHANLQDHADAEQAPY